MSIEVELTDEQSARLESLAQGLRVEASELARAAVADLINRPSDDFRRAATYVVEKNRNLYERLR